MLDESPIEALLSTSRLPRTTSALGARFALLLRQRFPATYMREPPATLLFSVSSHVLPVRVANM